MDQQIRDFLSRFANYEHTEEEYVKFTHWLETASDQEVKGLLELYPHIEQEFLLTRADRQQMSRGIEETLDRKTRHTDGVVSLKAFYRIGTAAAAIIIIFCIGFYFKQNTKRGEVVVKATQKESRTEPRAPGTNSASLTLSNGKIILLDEVKTGLLATESGIKINKSANGQLIYDASSASSITASTGFNTIFTPRGSQHQLILPDGSKVWLNAASSLKFPVRFDGNVRSVELSGEAYFEVVKNKEMPFIVNSGEQVVEVLGTTFNINAYTDEHYVCTTLLEGSIRLSEKRSNTSRILKPGQQARLDRDIKVSETNAEQAIAWKNGYFIFDEENIQSIMRKMARWYDIDVQYEGKVSNEGFIGSVSRYDSLLKALKMLQLTGLVRFEVIGRTVVVRS